MNEWMNDDDNNNNNNNNNNKKKKKKKNIEGHMIKKKKTIVLTTKRVTFEKNQTKFLLFKIRETSWLSVEQSVINLCFRALSTFDEWTLVENTKSDSNTKYIIGENLKNGVLVSHFRT